ncbi:MAG TPA: hypothetical protein VED40_12415 [Azospirillaceae bacterium]|nr:hypothetical protein [Azospirillaceae bacterium]
MKHFSLFAAAASLLLTSGCASIVEGTSQDLTVNVTPAEAVCTVAQKGKDIGSVTGSKPTINVGKSRHDLAITCNAPGYEVQTARIESSASGWGVAGAVTLDFGLTDYMTGALNKYPEAISIAMVKKGETAPAAAAAAVTPAAAPK